MNIAAIGNCQMGVMEEILNEIIPSAKIVRVTIEEVQREEKINDVKKCDLIVLHNTQPVLNYLEKIPAKAIKVELPVITFKGYSPDCIYVTDTSFASPITYHSLIVLSAFWSGLNEAECLKMFNSRVYAYLGYPNEFHIALNGIKAQLRSCSLPESFAEEWVNSGRFMYTTNHPKTFIVEQMLKEKLLIAGIGFRKINFSESKPDKLQKVEVYPNLVDNFSQKPTPLDEIFFKSSRGEFFSLEEFIKESFKLYRKVPASERKQRLWHPKLDELGLYKIASFYKSLLSEPKKTSILSRFLGNADSSQYAQSPHPYQGLANHHFWRRAIANVALCDVDPVINFNLKISPNDKVATAGSCFAQHIAKHLKQSGYNYYKTEDSSQAIDSSIYSASADAFSAHYGNIYTVKQLLQLFESAFDNFHPKLVTWSTPNGKVTDPYRPRVFEDGLNSPKEVLQLRQQHLAAVRKMFETLDVFVFTLGLTEGWEVVEDSAALPLAPGVSGGIYIPEEYRFVNYDVQSIEADLTIFIQKLRAVNPKTKLILTVSPVPLMATYETEHVLVANTLSKSVLRVVANKVCKAFSGVHYFPSFELIAGHYNQAKYYQADLREVNAEGVNHAMRLFKKHYMVGTTSSSVGINDGLAEVVCDESLLDPKNQ